MAAAPRLLSRVRSRLARGAGLAWRGLRGGSAPAAKGCSPAVFLARGRGLAVALGAALICGSPVFACVVPYGGDVVGTIARWDQGGVIEGTGYRVGTDAYGHGIMGRVRDADRLFVISSRSGSSCKTIEAAAGPDHVFEDIAPRLVDLDGDDIPEIIAVRSSYRQGAQLAVYGLRGDGLRLIGATPYIGTRHRWLAPAAWEDLDGDGHVEIAYVDRPHLAKTLRVWRWKNGRLQQVASRQGITNHAIGDEIIHSFTRNCPDGSEIVLQSADRTRLVGVKLVNDRLEARDLGPANRMEALRTC